MKNMLYLWKCYLEEINIPNIIFTTALKTILKTKLEYNETDDVFHNYTSTYLPLVSNFLKFWEESIIEDNNEYYFEIDELSILFKHWGNKAKIINDDKIINLIKHFFPEIIIEDKFIYGISCNLWNKREDIIKFIKYKLSTLSNVTDTISVYEFYKEYSLYSKKNKSRIIIGKTYFDLFVKNFLKSYINENIINLNDITII